MTKEQLRDDIVLSMSRYLGKEELKILKDVLIDKLQNVEIEAPQYLATTDTSNEYLIQMFNAFKGQRLSEKSMKLYNFTLTKFCETINKPLTQVTGTDIEYFLMRQNCSEVTLNNYRRNLSAFFTWAVKKRIITFNPVDEVEPYKEIKKPIDNLNAAEQEAIKEGCETTRERALIEFLRSTAVRVGECINVKISDIDFTTGKVLIYGEKTKTYRTQLLDSVALGYIKKYVYERGLDLNSNEPLFTSLKSGNALTSDGVRSILHTISKKSNLDRRVYPHLFRKSCATLIIRRGGTVGDAGDYLGHAEDTVTGKHYTYKDDSHIVNIFNKYVAIV